jgi:iron-regulated transporter 1
MWEFSVGLYMIRIWPDSLLFAAVYGVVEASSVAVFGPMVGTLVDRLTYLKVRQLLTLVDRLTWSAGSAPWSAPSVTVLRCSGFK